MSARRGLSAWEWSGVGLAVLIIGACIVLTLTRPPDGSLWLLHVVWLSSGYKIGRGFEYAKNARERERLS